MATPDVPSPLSIPPLSQKIERLRAEDAAAAEAAKALLAEQVARARAFAADLQAQLPPTLRVHLTDHHDGDLGVHVVSTLPGVSSEDSWGAYVGRASWGIDSLLREVNRSRFVKDLSEVEQRAPERAEIARRRRLDLADLRASRARMLRAGATAMLLAALAILVLSVLIGRAVVLRPGAAWHDLWWLIFVGPALWLALGSDKRQRAQAAALSREAAALRIWPPLSTP